MPLSNAEKVRRYRERQKAKKQEELKQPTPPSDVFRKPFFEFFPPEQQEQMRRQISESVRAVLSQRLVSAIEGGGRLPVLEALVTDSVSRSVIQEGEFSKIPSILESGGESGSQSFNRDLFRLLQDGKISKKDALQASSNPKALEMNLKGIFLSSGGIIG